MFETPGFTGVLGVIIGSVVTLVATYLNNKSQREIIRLNLTYKHRLKIISKFLLNLINARHSLEPFVYCDLDIEAIKHERKLFLQLKQRLVEIRITERDLYKNIKKELEKLYDLINYLIDAINVYSRVPWEVNDEPDRQIIKRMEQFISLSKKIEKKVFESKNL